jgi:hypothetical protein
MKKYVILLLIGFCVLFMFSINQTFAQYAYFGLKGGVTISHLRGDDADPEIFWGTGSEQKPRIGFVGGAYSTIVLTKIIAIQPELLFSMMGTKYDWEEAGEYDYWVMKFNYIQLPVLFKAYIPMEGAIKPHVFIGGYVSYNFSAKYSNEWYLPSYGFGSGNVEEDIDGNMTWGGSPVEMNKFDYGISFGLGSDFIVKGYQLTLDARYSLGFAKLITPDVGTEPDLKNGVFSVMVGFGF